MTQQVHLSKLLRSVKESGKKFISLELYPSSDVDVKELNDLCPNFCAITWNHGDVTSPGTLKELALAGKLRDNGYNLLLHLAGRNLNRQDVSNVLNEAKQNGIRNIFALIGGAPKIEPDDSNCDFPYAIDLVRFIKENYGDYFNVAVSGYPIGHPASEDPLKDLDYLKEKIDAGGDVVICQAVFDAETFRKFYQRCRALGIDVPLVPGAYIINSYQQFQNLKLFCKIVPEAFEKFMTEHKDDDAAIRRYGIDNAADLITSLLSDKELSITGVHVFSFNKLDLVEEVYKKLDFAELKVARPLRLRCATAQI